MVCGIDPRHSSVARERWTSLGVRSAEPSAHGTTYDVGYPVTALPEFRRDFREVVEKARPDVVVSQLEGGIAILEGLRFASRRVLLLRAFEHYRGDGTYPDLRRFVEGGGIAIANAGVLSRALAPHLGVELPVVYPLVDVNEYRTERPSPDHVTFVNPVRVKGVEVFLEVAARMPEQRFLVVEGWPVPEREREELLQRFALLPNVRYVPRVDDMREVYASTAILMVPSVYEETFGRVVLEAQASGIPVVASPRGGLPEVVGDGGLVIDDYLAAGAWVTALRGLLQDPARRRELSLRATANANRDDFSVERNVSRFLELCSGR